MDEATQISEELVRVTPADDELFGSYVFNFAGDLQNRYNRYGNLPDLIAAKANFHRSMTLFPKDHYNHRMAVRQQISLVLGDRAEARLSIEDIDLAIKYARESVDAASGVPAQQSLAFQAVGERLAVKFALFGGMGNLEESMKARRNTVDILPADHKDTPMKLHALANSLRNNFEHYGKMSDLDESILLARRAVRSIPTPSVDRCMALDGLSNSLSMRYKQTGSSQDLDEAVTASEAAVGDLPKGRKERYGYLNGLSNRLNSRYTRSRDKQDLDRAIEAVSEAVSACEDGSDDQCIYLNTLGNCLLTRFEAFGDMSDLDASIEKGRKYLSKIPKTHPFRVNGMHNLGLRLQTKYFRAADDEKETLLKEALELATKCSYDTPLGRIKNGQLGGYCFMQAKSWERAGNLLSESVKLFRRASPVSLGDQDRQRRLRDLSGISSLACACYLAMEQPERGLEILEAGRGIMSDIAMGYHSDLSALRMADKSLHDEYVRLRNQLSQPLPEAQTSSSHAEDSVAKRNEDLARFEAVEASIRLLPELESFNQSLSAQQMKDLAVQGPLVAFCTVDQRCDAIIVTPEKIEAVPLPELTNAAIKERVNLIVGKSRLSTMPPSKHALANKRMRALLEWIWEKAVRPVLQHLGLLESQGRSSRPRIWWVTSGAMGLLPLHAAGKGAKNLAENTYAHVVSTYIPTFAGLAFARQCQDKVDPVSPNMALVTMPETPGGLEPLSTEHESQAIRDVFAATSDSHKELLELCLPSATDVLTHVRGSNVDIVHLACHADPNLDDPSNTALLFGSEPAAPAPDPLPVRQLRRMPTEQQKSRRPPRLAYLSACCTAQQYDLRLIDENIHLAAAFQLCGFPAVVGTLWEADDVAAVVIAKAFYAELFRLDYEDHQGQPGDHVARALDFATGIYRSLKIGRASAANDALAWASFVHIGA
ncbi:hypothetical protein K491DRAFT_618519, partial [Lophiostoma macrostomum CBS 122681]